MMRFGAKLRRSIAVSALLLFVATADTALAGPVVTTTTTTYQYNVDNALTSITTQTDSEEATTTYVTWDDFLPDATDPTTGTVTQGNGRVLGYGSSPGTFVEQFQFDRRDRLTGYSGNGQTVAYDFHPTEMMSSATQSGASPWRFYYDLGRHPQVTNIHEQDSDLWSSYLNQTRYVSDGSEQTLIQPRKDVACLYDPQSETVIPYRFDPFGARSTSSNDSYELSENPFQYSNEFRDPVWGGYYLRARWYHPDLPSFLSRDPMSDQLNRFAYAGANPEMNTDPGGMLHSLGWGLKKLNKIPGLGDFARVAFAGPLGVLELAAHPNGFWHSIKYNTNGTDVFLFGPVVLTWVLPSGTAALSESFALRLASTSLGKRFSGVLLSDFVLGATQTIVSAALSRGTHHWNWETFREGMEYTVGGIAWARMVAGIGYSPYKLKATNVEGFVNANRSILGDDDVLVFRERDGGLRIGNRTYRPTSPWQEKVNLGIYHERVIAVTKDGMVAFNHYERGIAADEVDAGSYFRGARNRRSEFTYVGVKQNQDVDDFVHDFKRSTPNRLPTRSQVLSRNFQGTSRFSYFWNNCQDHALAVRREFGVE